MEQIFSLSNYYFNPFSIPPFLAAVAVFSLGLSAFLKKKSSIANIAFLIFCIGPTQWLFGTGMYYSSRYEEMIRFWYVHVTLLGVVIIYPGIYFFTVALVGRLRDQKWFVLLSYLAGFLFYLLAVHSDHFYIGAKKFFWGWYPQYGAYSYPFYLFLFSVMLVGFWNLFSAFRKSDSLIEKQQIKYVSAGFLVGNVAAVDFIACYDIGFYPFGYLPITVFVAIIVYTMQKFQLFLITPALAADTIIDTMAESLVVFGLDGKIMEVNPVTTGLLGYEKQDLIGKPIEGLFVEKEHLRGEVMNSLLLQRKVRNYEMTYRTRTGEDIPVSCSISPVKDKLGTMIGFVGIARDVRETKNLIKALEKELSDRRKAEEELQKAYEELKNTQQQLVQSEKMSAVGQLAAGVAHEINNPLGVILGFAQALSQKIKLDDPLGMPVRSIEREAIRCKKLVQDLLTFSRAGLMDHVPVNLNDAVEGALSLIGAGGKMSSVTIEKEFAPDLPMVSGNQNQIQQIVINLANNAIDAMPQGGTLRIQTDVLRDASGLWSRLRVLDTGIGIPEEIRSRIFDPFFTTKAVGEGTGLGLSLVFEIVKKHSGSIEVKSRPGSTEFCMKFPVATRM